MPFCAIAASIEDCSRKLCLTWTIITANTTLRGPNGRHAWQISEKALGSSEPLPVRYLIPHMMTTVSIQSQGEHRLRTHVWQDLAFDRASVAVS